MKRRIGTLTALAVAVVTLALAAPGLAATGKVNINTAGPEQLELLPRVGPALSSRIVEYREKNGGFRAPEDLMLVRGIGEASFERLKPYVAVSGETTLAEKVASPRKASAKTTD
ncbi:MAG: ComEA family DNA-binding protein [Thermoanaerobaculia bacterium]